ncbi:MAG: hypothetical protein IKC32_05290 [Clostridia bacterium]|nr:hypothetical protein [Clostridia bacterium]
MSEEIKGKTPDLSRIVNLIMENPKLIEEISALAKSEEQKSSEPEEQTENTATSVEPTYESSNSRSSRERRAQLLSALKPYLSGERQKAIDSMMTFADVFDAMRGR